jgi:phosphoribosylamine--glycine ligase
MTLVQPTRILVVGSGGREHALAWKLAAEPGVNEVVVAPGSDAIASESRVRSVPLDPLDAGAVLDYALRFSAELVVVGPEAPLAAGVVDALSAAGIPAFGPTRAAARIETSKAYCRDIAESAGIPMAEGRAFEPAERRDAVRYARDLAATSDGVVVKADGLAGGKGVTVCATESEADAVLATIEGRIVVEERLVGREASVIALADGVDAVALPVARDHKRLLDGDRGPNTGGMGAYSPVADLPDDDAAAIVEAFHVPALRELRKRETPFRGALYAGLILTERGPRLLEFNARCGDPETQVILPRLAGPLAPWLRAAARGALPAETPRRLPMLPGATVGIVLAADGYPGEPRNGAVVDGLDAARAEGALVFHSGTVRDDEGRFRTRGGRVLTVVGRGPDVGSAREAAERAADRISWSGMRRRRDIALDVPVVETVA